MRFRAEDLSTEGVALVAAGEFLVFSLMTHYKALLHSVPYTIGYRTRNILKLLVCSLYVIFYRKRWNLSWLSQLQHALVGF
jgi:hypothetical protein